MFIKENMGGHSASCHGSVQSESELQYFTTMINNSIERSSLQ